MDILGSLSLCEGSNFGWENSRAQASGGGGAPAPELRNTCIPLLALSGVGATPMYVCMYVCMYVPERCSQGLGGV